MQNSLNTYRNSKYAHVRGVRSYLVCITLETYMTVTKYIIHVVTVCVSLK